MFTQLRIQNFKAWKDTGNIRLAPLTVFFGPNSSGKTSLLQLLLLLQQSEQSSDRKRVLHFGDNHSAVDLGVYPEMIFRHAPQRELRFALKWRVPGSLQASSSGDRTEPRETMVAFKASVGSTDGDSGPISVHSFQYTVCGANIGPLTVKMRRDDMAGGYEISARGYDLQRKPEMSGRLSAPVRFYGFPREATAHYMDTGLFDNFELALEEQLESIHYLGPLRELPDLVGVAPFASGNSSRVGSREWSCSTASKSGQLRPTGRTMKFSCGAVAVPRQST